MSIIRVERAVYGVDDVEECARFFGDFGLSRVEAAASGAAFRTRSGQVVEVRHFGDPDLPPSLDGPNTLREVVWGVDDVASLEDLVALVGVDREVSWKDGTAHAVDETGFGVGLTRAAEIAVPAIDLAYNTSGAVSRVNDARSYPGPVYPLRLCHVALNIPKQGRHSAVAFYVDRLGFKVSDDVLDMGTFLRADGDTDQHTLLLCHRPDRAGVNHTAYEVEGFDEVIVGVNEMIENGWREARKLGRHTLGSNVFRFVHAPCGGRVELAADMDRVDDSYGPNVHEKTPPHHIWQLANNRDEGGIE